MPGTTDRAVAAPRPAGDTLRGLGLLLITAFSWGLNWPLVKYLLSELPPFTTRALAGAIGLTAAFAFAAWRGEALMPPPGQWRPLAISAFLNFTSFAAASTLGMLWLSASEAVIIAYTMPLWAVLLAWPLLGERPGLARIAALMLGLGGVAVLMSSEPINVTSAKLPGMLIAFAGAWLFALGTVLTKRRPPALPPVASVAWQVGLGSAPMAVPALFEHPHWAAVPEPAWLGVVWLGLVPVTFAYVAWFRALRLLPASTASVAILMVPVIGVFGSGLLLGEPLGARQLGALALTLLGVGLAVRA